VLVLSTFFYFYHHDDSIAVVDLFVMVNEMHYYFYYSYHLNDDIDGVDRMRHEVIMGGNYCVDDDVVHFHTSSCHYYCVPYDHHGYNNLCYYYHGMNGDYLYYL